ncbi:MAG: hypothetical protein ACKPEO_05385 [Sphaerospermopsis kisseleviana]
MANQINVLRTVEEALGFQFNIFSLPFLTVEGDEELTIFRKLQERIKTPNIFCLKGSSNITPWLQASRMNENFQGIFLLDIDVDIIEKISNIDSPLSLVANLEENFLFIGKSIYTFDQVYKKDYIECKPKDYSDDIIWIHILILAKAYTMERNLVISRFILSKSSFYKIKHYKMKQNFNECLEDFIATNLFETEEEGYKHFVKIAEEVICEFICTHSDLKVKNPKRGLECFLEKENKEKKFQVMVNCILTNITHENSQLKTDLHKKIKDRLKTKILDDTLHRDLKKFSKLIDEINQKFKNL